ncbi:uncharacterized protein LOC130216695 [Danio aesculapii]|uniref:uncharacterized protein LOC130216695 n=1 Tax=Danio aesculapii TaxID=1142201 RepID=UPI0024BFD2E9|nr:uncharacterized protein LOC130216695 [Danio aesculapii]
MTLIIFSLLLLVSLLPDLTLTAHVGIVNGSVAKPHSRPYMVSVQLDGQHICGGFLITEKFVLSAAHCWNGKENLTVVVGAHNLTQSNASNRMEVESYIQHTSYNSKFIWNDIMLFKLKEKVTQNSYVRWISISKKRQHVNADTPCSVAGWGLLLTNGSLSDCLMEANVYITNNTECKTKWGENFLVSQMMCTHGHGGSCRYDSGGPLVCGDTAVGITSFGDPSLCNAPKHPNVYTRISVYRQWIDSVIKKKKRDNISNYYRAFNFIIASSLIIFIMTIIIISLLLLVSLVPDLTFTARVGIVNGKEIEKKVKLNNNVKPISLARDGKHNEEGTVCSAAGWGDLWMKGPLSGRLMEANVTTKKDAFCQDKWGSYYVASKMICVHGEGGSCTADSGGPLVCGNTAVGVTSFGDPSIFSLTSEGQVWQQRNQQEQRDDDGHDEDYQDDVTVLAYWYCQIGTKGLQPSNIIIMIFSVLLVVYLLPNLTLQASVKSGIVNENEARPHSRPYMVSVQSNKKHICGGFLVSEQFVMTAAHCFTNGEVLTVVVGAHEYTDGSSRMDVKFYHIHPGFESETLVNDIMLLQLHKKAKKSNKVNWIPIPTADKDIKAKTKCSVAGWGKNTTHGEASAKLMEVNVTVFDKKACQKYWGQTYFTSKMMCTGGHGGFCQGDSGGPLVCDKVAVGIVSFNEKNNCDSPTKPNVYTKISRFLSWIKCILGGVKQEFDCAIGADIINGKKAKKGSLLYMASVQIIGKHSCGGFLIDPSYGDSGGPLVCSEQAVGIVSFNMGHCDYPNAPNIYTQISKYTNWIKKVIRGGA